MSAPDRIDPNTIQWSGPIGQQQAKNSADVRQSGASAGKSEIETRRTGELLPYDKRKAAADAAAAEAGVPYAGRSAAAKTAKDEADARTAQAGADKIEREAGSPAQAVAVARALMLRGIQQYRRDIQGRPASRAFGYMERFDKPTAFGVIPAVPKYEAFTSLGNEILPLIRPLIARTAKEGDSDKEMTVFQSYIPQASDGDQTIESKFAALDTLLAGLAERKPPSVVLAGGLRTRTLEDVERNIIRDAEQLSPEKGAPPSLLPEFAPEKPDGLSSMPRMPDVWRQGDAPQEAQLGDKSFVQDTELRINAQLQKAFDEGKRPEELQALAEALYGGIGASSHLDPAKLDAAVRYRDEFLKNGGVGPSGATIAPREKPIGAAEQNTIESLQSAPKAFAREYGDAASMGVGPDITALFNPELAQSMRFTRGRMREASPYASAAGDLLGSLGPTAGLTAAGTRAGLKPVTSSLVGDIVYNTTRGATEDPEHRVAGALVGGGMGLIGGTAGRWTGAPGLEALGRKYIPGMPTEAPTRAETTLATRIGDVDLAEQRLREAMDLGLPYGLADTTTEAQQLASRSAREGPKAAEVVESVFPERLAARGERAADAVDQYVAPHLPDVRAREEDIRTAAQRAAGPLYDKAYAQPVIADKAISNMLDTQYGRAGLKRVLNDMEAQGIDPYETGIVLNEQGNPVARKELSWETLHRVREGVSNEIEQFRDPITRKTSRDAEPWVTFLKRFDARLDTLNPDYKAAREVYAKNIEPMDFLHNGLEAAGAKVPPADIQRTLARINKMPANTPEEIALRDEALKNYREGYATSLRSSIDNRATGSDAYAAVAGTRRQQEKLRLIGVDPGTFQKQLDAEQRMAVTSGATRDAPVKHASSDAQDTLAGMDVVDVLGRAFGGVPGANLGAIARNVAYRPVMWQRGREALGFGVPRRQRMLADEIAPELMGNDPEAALNALLGRQKTIADYATFADPIRATSTILGGTAAGVIGRQAPDEPAPYSAPRPLDQNLLAAGIYGQGAKINADGSVTTPDGKTVDAGAARQQIGGLANSLSRYYDKPAPETAGLPELQSRYPEQAPAPSASPAIPPDARYDPATHSWVLPDGTRIPAPDMVSPRTGQ